MPRSVIITTPIPTLEEYGKSLGLSKRQQQSLLRLMERDARPRRKVADHVKNGSASSKDKPNTASSRK